MLMPRDDHLRNPLARNNLEGFFRKIHQDHEDFAAIIGIDGTRRVEHRDSLLRRQPAAGTEVGTMARWSGFNTTGSVMAARKSIPADNGVA